MIGHWGSLNTLSTLSISIFEFFENSDLNKCFCGRCSFPIIPKFALVPTDTTLARYCPPGEKKRKPRQHYQWPSGLIMTWWLQQLLSLFTNQVVWRPCFVDLVDLVDLTAYAPHNEHTNIFRSFRPANSDWHLARRLAPRPPRKFRWILANF